MLVENVQFFYLVLWDPGVQFYNGVLAVVSARVALCCLLLSFFFVTGGWNVWCHDSGCFYLRLIYLHARKQNGSHPLALYTLPF